MGTIHLKTYQFKSESNPQSHGKWYPRVEHYSTIGTKELCQLAAEDSHLEPSEVEYILSSVVKQISELVFNGHTIAIPGLGTLSIAADTQTVEDYADVRCNTLIKQLRLNLRVTPELRKELNQTTVVMK
jgi:predicted histone-like DNA-binding protein